MAAPEIESSEYFFRIGRNAAKAKVDQLRRPIARPSSIPGRYAVSYYDAEGNFVHSLFGAMRVLTRRGDIDIIYIGEGESRREFTSPGDFIEYIRSINPSAYAAAAAAAGNENEDPRPLGGRRKHSRRHRSRSRRHRKHARTRRS